ncbi:unnamed protein product [Closterium sp. NIES-54]
MVILDLHLFYPQQLPPFDAQWMSHCLLPQRQHRHGMFAWGKGLGFESRRVCLGGYGRTLTRYLKSPSIPMARSPGGLWAHSDPLLNKPFYPDGLVIGILTWCPKGLGFESRCMHM